MQKAERERERAMLQSTTAREDAPGIGDRGAISGHRRRGLVGM